MKNLVEWFGKLPTWGKIGVIVGAISVVALVIWYVRNYLGGSGGGSTLPLPTDTGNNPANVYGAAPSTVADSTGGGANTSVDSQAVTQEVSALSSMASGLQASEAGLLEGLQGLASTEASLATDVETLGARSQGPTPPSSSGLASGVTPAKAAAAVGAGVPPSAIQPGSGIASTFADLTAPEIGAVFGGVHGAPLSDSEIQDIRTMGGTQPATPLTSWQQQFLKTGGNTTIPKAPGGKGSVYTYKNGVLVG